MKRALIPIGLAVIFAAPLAMAWALFQMHDWQHEWQPRGGLQHGELLQPLQPLLLSALTSSAGQPLDSGLFRGRWTLLYHTAQPCTVQCRQLLATLHNVRLAQGQAMAQVQRVLVLTTPPAAQELPALQADDLQVIRAAHWPLPAGWVYLLDPHGNLVLRYAPGFAPKGLLQDLQRLLKQAGAQ